MKPLPTIDDLSRPYWQAAREGRLTLQHCAKCQRAIFYPRPWCPHCWHSELEWRDVSGRGRVVTWTIVHHPPSPAFASDVPYVLAVIRLAEGPQMMANLFNTPHDAIRLHLPVRVTFEARGDWQIPQFEIDTEAK